MEFDQAVNSLRRNEFTHLSFVGCCTSVGGPCPKNPPKTAALKKTYIWHCWQKVHRTDIYLN